MFSDMTTDEITTFFFFWAVAAGFVAVIAGARGRSRLAWFVISFLLSPLIGFIGVMVQPNLAATPPPALPPCPRCQTPRTSGQRHCLGCNLDLWADYDARRA